LHIKPSQKVGICGRTGSGKSTLVSTLLRILDLQEGSILIDELPLDKIARKTIRDRLICLPQDALVFPRSFRFNLDPESRLNQEADLTDALRAVGLQELVMSRGGLEADMGELSHGQRQLLALARAVLRKKILNNRCILVLDEATSNLDIATEEIVRKVIHEEFKENTVISVAHRLDTVRDADMIVVLEKGKISKSGPPSLVL